MKFILFFMILISNFFNSLSFDYLSNSQLSYNVSQMEIDFWQDKPITGYHNSYPPSGINCITGKENEKIIYLISSQSLLNRHSKHDSCNSQKRTISVIKRDLNISKNINHMVIGEEYTGNKIYKCYRWNEHDMEMFDKYHGHQRYLKEKEYCENKGFFWKDNNIHVHQDCHCSCCQKIIRPVGGKGSDHITSCGIDSYSNILYFIGGNFHNCPSNYNTQPSLVRINLTSFQFIDRTILNEINGFNKFANWSSQYLLNREKYFNYPKASEIYNGNIFLSFENYNTGIWVINVRSDKLEIINGYQKKIEIKQTIPDGNTTKTITSYVNLPAITKSLLYNNTIYFISENYYDNAKILVLNLKDTNYFNNSQLHELDGINNIKSIQVDTLNNNIYILKGQLTSEIYKLDFSFNVIPISHDCNIDSLVIPSKWKAAHSMEIDSIAGFVYLFFIKEPYNGFVVIRIKDMKLNPNFNQFIFNRHDQGWTPNYLNTTIINRETGKLFVANTAHEESFFMAIVEIDLLGCAEGRRFNNKTCQICIPGTYTDSKGLSYCKLCQYGYSTTSDESEKCNLCNIGKYANLLGSTSCFNCPTGKFSETRGASLCTNCKSGKYNVKISSITSKDCLDCDIGKYSVDGSDSCQFCQVGRFTKEKRLCIPCPKGKYSNILGITGANECIDCPKGRYNNMSGSQNINLCLICPVGKISSIIGGFDVKICKSCEAGMYRNKIMDAGSECAKCSNGKYSGTSFNECLNCPPGKYNNGINAKDHIDCKNCPKGKYNELEGANNINKCLECEIGKYSELEGNSNSSNCKYCNLGSYNDIKSSSSENDCKVCPSGKYNNYYGGVSINDCIDCSIGKISENSVSCNSCLSGKFNDIQGSSECQSCPVGKFSNKSDTVICDNCPENSESSVNRVYCECLEGTYKTNNNPLECTICPPHFICDKGSTIETLKLEKKYWRANKYTLKVEECKKGYNCIGGIINETSNELCNIGHTGPICDVCIDGWAKNDGKCFKCLSSDGVKARSYIFTILFPLIISCIIFFMIKTANPSSNTEQKEPLSGVIKIFMNYAQIFTLASSFEINWPDIVVNLFDRTKEFSSPRISFYSSDCTIGWTYYDKLLIYILLPIIYTVIVTLILSIYTFIFYKKKRLSKINSKFKNDSEKDKYLLKNPNPMVFYKSWMCTSILIGLFLAWPTIIKQSLSIIPCKQYGDKYYLLEDLAIECYTSKYYSYLILSYFSLGIYGLLVPLIAFNLIRSRRYTLYDFETKYEMPAPLSFLFLGYREETWYYEFIVMAKKYCLIVITVFLKEYSRYQMISASLFIQAAFFIHVFVRPYDSITNYGILCNKLESSSLLALVVTLNSGLFFGTVSDNHNLGNFEIFLIVILFLMNILVMLYFLFYLVKLTFNESIDIFKKLFLKIYEKNCCIIKCLSPKKKESIYKWSKEEKIDTHGINLKTPDEIELFQHFFNDKKMFSHQLKNLLKDEDISKLGLILKKIRSKIEIIEKQRCWMSIQNNRLYKHLQDELLNNKDKIRQENIENLNNVLSNYINNGLKYSKRISKISNNALKTIRKESVIEMKEIDSDVVYESSSNSETEEELY